MIYFLQSGESGPVKIGHTKGIVTCRLRQLQHSSPYELSVLGAHEGDHEVEQSLHRRFQDFRFRNEWFHPVKSLLKHIEDMGGLEALHRLDRTDLRIAVSQPMTRLWTLETRSEFRSLIHDLGRPYTAWREYMALPSVKVCVAVEEFLISKGIEFGVAAVNDRYSITSEVAA